MNQKKYIISAVLLLIVAAVIFLMLKKFPQESDAVSFENETGNERNDSLNQSNYDGKMLFMAKCASCHHISKKAVGPALAAVEERGPWKDSIKLYQYIRNPESLKKDKYVDSVRKEYSSKHLGFPDLTNEEIRAILRYTYQYKAPPVLPAAVD